MQVVVESRFRRRLKRKGRWMQEAIAECIQRLSEDPTHPGLNVHRVQGAPGVWEAYIDQANRLTFHYDDDGRIVLRNHCNHSIVKQSP